MKNLSENLSEILAEAMMDPENVTPSQLFAEEFVKMFPMCLPEVVSLDDSTGELVVDAMALEKKIKRWGLMWNFKPAVTAKLASLGVNSVSILGGGRHEVDIQMPCPIKKWKLDEGEIYIFAKGDALELDHWDIETCFLYLGQPKKGTKVTLKNTNITLDDWDNPMHRSGVLEICSPSELDIQSSCHINATGLQLSQCQGHMFNLAPELGMAEAQGDKWVPVEPGAGKVETSSEDPLKWLDIPKSAMPDLELIYAFDKTGDRLNTMILYPATDRFDAISRSFITNWKDRGFISFEKAGWEGTWGRRRTGHDFYRV